VSKPTRRKRLFVYRLVGNLALACLLWLALSLGVVFLFRWVDPPTTAVMLLQPGRVSDIDYRWVGRHEIAWSAARAVICHAFASMQTWARGRSIADSFSQSLPSVPAKSPHIWWRLPGKPLRKAR